MKAVYLFNFTQFVQWPGEADKPTTSFSICVLGRDSFLRTLDDTIAGQTVYGRSIIVARIAGPEEAPGCRILYISVSEEERLEQILAAIRQSDILTVSDMPYFTQRGGMIQFTTDSNRVRFAVNLASAREAGLMLSSELLKLAVSVRQGSPSGH